MLCAVSKLAILFASVRAVASRAIAPRHGADSTFNPLVTYPTAGVVWYSGGDYTVSWVSAPLPLDPSGAKRRRSRGTLTLGATRQNPILPAGVNSSQVESLADIILGRYEDGTTSLSTSSACAVCDAGVGARDDRLHSHRLGLGHRRAALQRKRHEINLASFKYLRRS